MIAGIHAHEAIGRYFAQAAEISTRLAGDFELARDVLEGSHGVADRLDLLDPTGLKVLEDIRLVMLGLRSGIYTAPDLLSDNFQALSVGCSKMENNLTCSEFPSEIIHAMICPDKSTPTIGMSYPESHGILEYLEEPAYRQYLQGILTASVLPLSQCLSLAYIGGGPASEFIKITGLFLSRVHEGYTPTRRLERFLVVPLNSERLSSKQKNIIAEHLREQAGCLWKPQVVYC